MATILHISLHRRRHRLLHHKRATLKAQNAEGSKGPVWCQSKTLAFCQPEQPPSPLVVVFWINVCLRLWPTRANWMHFLS